jgi:hypothetical protein
MRSASAMSRAARSGIEEDKGAAGNLIDGKRRPRPAGGFTIASDFCGRVVWVGHQWFARTSFVWPVL